MRWIVNLLLWLESAVLHFLFRENLNGGGMVFKGWSSAAIWYGGITVMCGRSLFGLNRVGGGRIRLTGSLMGGDVVVCI